MAVGLLEVVDDARAVPAGADRISAVRAPLFLQCRTTGAVLLMDIAKPMGTNSARRWYAKSVSCTETSART